MFMLCLMIFFDFEKYIFGKKFTNMWYINFGQNRSIKTMVAVHNFTTETLIVFRNLLLCYFDPIQWPPRGDPKFQPSNI